MLDPSVSAQLQQIYRDLPVTVVLRQRPSDHPKQAELTTMLEDVAAANPQRIVRRLEGESSAIPAFEVAVEGKPCVPTGWRASDTTLPATSAVHERPSATS